MSQRVRARVAACAVLCLGLLAPAWALPFTVLIDVQPCGSSPGRIEPGAIQCGGSYNNNQSGNLSTQSLVTLGGDPFTLAIDNVNMTGGTTGGIDWRDRGNKPAPVPTLAQLAEDFVKNNSGIIRVTLGGPTTGYLPAGWYQVTSYHVDSDNRQCEEICVYVSDARTPGGYSGIVGYGDALYFGANPGAGNAGLDSITTAVIQNTAAQFYIFSDGTSPIRIVFSGVAAYDTEVPLSGIQIVPSSAPPLTGIVGPVGQDFDTPGGLSYRPTISASNTSTEAYWGLVSQKPAGVAVPTTFSGTSGDFFLGQRVNDSLVAGGDGTTATQQHAYLSFQLLDFAQMRNVQFSLSLGAATGVWEQTTNYTSSNDYLVIEMDADLDGTYETVIDRFSGALSGGSGDLVSLFASSPYYLLPLGTTLTTLTYSLPGADGQMISLRLRHRSDNLDETIAIDNILFTGTLIPEPATLGLLAAGLLGLARRRRRRA